jgi:Cu(I)/Ag(I) efflux system membrane fusion protein
LTALVAGALATFALAFVLGYLVAPRDGSDASPGPNAGAESGATTWTCSMHPQIKLPEPGKCPICFMDLIPVEDDSDEPLGPRQLQMSETAARLAEIQTTPVKRQYATNVVRMVGKVDYDETRVANITAWVPGRLDRLFVDYTGVTVREGDHLVSMYSPALIVAQRELLQAMKSAERLASLDRELPTSTLRSAEEKLRLLGLLPEQIEEIKRRGAPTDHLTIYAPTGGIVIEKLANEGTYVETGTQIYTIADLSLVWVFLEAYESDVPWLRYGQDVEFTTQAQPGEIFHGRIAFIDPILDDQTRTVQVRVNVPNEDGRLKPGMFVRAAVRSRMAAAGKVFDPSLIGKWISPMHPEIVKDGPGKCDVCGMDLVPAEELGYAVPKKAPEVPLVIPATAPLITGKRAVVYVRLPDREQPTFEGREVLLGERAGDSYIVRHGLREGELVVTNGNFKIDSALEIQAKPSMMNPEGGVAASGHEQGDAPGAAKAGEHTAGGLQEINVPASFRTRLNPVYERYLDAADALADDDLAVAQAAMEEVARRIQAVDASSLDEHAQSVWRQRADRIILSALEAAEATRRDDARQHFGALSRAAAALVSTFGHALEGPVYRFHCPMALDAKGADWLQASDHVRNPYYGPAMLTCGDLKSTYESQAPLNVPPRFQGQLADVYDAYLSLQTALADDRLDDARRSFAALEQAVSGADAYALRGWTLRAWQSAWAEMKPAFQGDWKAADIEELRKRFEPVSNTLLRVVEAFGHTGDASLHRAFCPMAFNNRGAAWLQAGEKIANPYFGHQMLRCGEIQREFPPAGALDREPARKGGSP